MKTIDSRKTEVVPCDFFFFPIESFVSNDCKFVLKNSEYSRT